MFFDIGLSNISLLSNVYPHTRETNKQINKWDSIRLKTFLHIKGKCKQNKNVASSVENIFANNISDEELKSKIYKELNNSTLENPQTTVLIMSRGTK